MTCLRYPPDIGGTEAAARVLAHALVATGHEVTVVTGATIAHRSQSTEHGVVVRRFPLPTGRGSGACYVAQATAVAIGAGRHDVVHAHMASAPAVAAIVVGALWRTPVVVKPSSGAGASGGNLADVLERRGGRWRVALLRRLVGSFVAV
ncbi:MAG TPA: glycosyltransferase, partial [Acidimicrobiales bacterium]|nr:glycosyltransferase [Acidimicrobiales bacterium]